MVKRWAALVVPTRWVPKSWAESDDVTVGRVPVPVSVMWTTLLAASLVRSSRASGCDPVLVGLNATSIVHVDPARSCWAVHPSLAIVYWVSSVPASTAPEIERMSVPVFVTVTRWAALVVPTRWLPKSCEFIDDVMAPRIPVPETETWSTAGAPSLEISSVAARLPEVVGANATSMLQVAFGASGWVHVLLEVVNCAASAPASWTEEIVSVADPEFVTTKVWGELVVPARSIAEVH